MRIFGALILAISFGVLAGCGDDSQIGAGGAGGSGGAGGMGGAGGAGGMAGSGGAGGMAGSGGTGGTSGGGGATGDFISLGGGTQRESETHVAADANGNIVAAWIAIFPDHTSSNGYTVSHNNGATWTAVKRIDSPATGAVASDPVVAVDGAGHFYVTWVGFVRTGGGQGVTDMHVYVSKLGASDTFGTPVETSDGASTATLDKPWITVDASNNVLVTWAKLGDSANPGATGLMFARSTDGGDNFTASTIVSGGGRNLMFPCVDSSMANAPYYVVYNAGSNVGLRRSTDGGATWATVSAAAPASGSVFQDPTCAVHGQDLWIAYPVGTDGFNGMTTPAASSVEVKHSTDGGANFGNAVTVSDGGSGVVYLNPYIVRTPGGKLEMIYYQGSEGQPATLTRAESTDGGATWNHSAMTMPGTFTLNRAALSWLGDYEGMYVAGGNVYTVFGDNSMSNTTHVRFMKLAAP